MPLTLTGDAAIIRWQYHVAAQVTAWTLTPGDGGLTLSGSLGVANHYRLSQRPLVFVLAQAGTTHRWPIQELQITGVSLSATLGPKESADVHSLSQT